MSLREFAFNKRIGSVLLLIIIMSGVFLLSGCDKTVEYGKEDVEKYLEEIGIKEYELAGERYEIEASDGGTDYCWDVKTDHFGFDEPITFHVIDHFYQPFLSPLMNELRDDTDSVIRAKIREIYEPTGDLTYYATDDSESIFFSYPIYGRNSFVQSYNEIVKFENFLKDYPNLSGRVFSVAYDLTDKGEAASIVDNVSPKIYAVFWFTALSSSKDEFRIWLEGEEGVDRGKLSDYLKRCLESGLIDRIDEFSQEEIDRCIDWHQDGRDPELTRVMDSDFNVLNERVVYAWYNGHIAFGNIYRLAKDAGLEVTGDYWDFSVIGADGNNYSFSYIGGESSYEGMEIPVSEASKILGVELDDGAKVYEWVVDKSLQEMLGMTEEDMINYIVDNSALTSEDIKVVEGSVVFNAKQKTLEGIIESNEKRMEELGRDLEKVDSDFAYQQSNVYSNLSIRMSKGGKMLNSEEEIISEFMSYALFNRMLAEPDVNPSVYVTVYYNDKDSFSQIPIVHFNFPEDRK